MPAAVTTRAAPSHATRATDHSGSSEPRWTRRKSTASMTMLAVTRRGIAQERRRAATTPSVPAAHLRGSAAMERTIRVGDVDLAVLEEGAGGRPLLLVHGFTGAK